MRNILRELPNFYQQGDFDKLQVPDDVFFKSMISSFAKQRDARLRDKHVRHIQNFQKLYKEMIKMAAGTRKPQQILPGIAERSKILNSEKRITGNGLIQIVEEIIQQVKKGLSHKEVQGLIDQIVFSHLNIPEVQISRHFPLKPRAIIRPDLYSKILDVVVRNSEDI